MSRACKPPDIDLPQPYSALADEGIGQCRSNGIYQLPCSKHSLHLVLLWLWTWLLQQTSLSPIILCRIRSVDPSIDLFFDMAALFSLWSIGMALAIADILEKTADEKTKQHNNHNGRIEQLEDGTRRCRDHRD